MTVLETIQRSTDFLTKKGVESPRLQAELLLAHVLKLPRMKLYLSFERTLAPAEVDTLRELVKRRGQREPLQHIIGSTCFCGFEIAVNRHVLVPRPETEILAELGWEYLATGRARSPQRADDSTLNQPHVLDFGTGSGCLAIAIAAKRPPARLTALDVSAEALAVARQNLAHHQLTERVQIVQGNGFAALPGGDCFDLIVSNPPYIPSAEIETLEPEVRDFDPRTALDGGADGLDCIRQLAREAPAFLAPGGCLMLEFGDGQAEAVRNLFSRQNWIVDSVREDYSQRARFLIARRD